MRAWGFLESFFSFAADHLDPHVAAVEFAAADVDVRKQGPAAVGTSAPRGKSAGFARCDNH